jgi:hypothetical protein
MIYFHSPPCLSFGIIVDAKKIRYAIPYDASIFVGAKTWGRKAIIFLL